MAQMPNHGAVAAGYCLCPCGEMMSHPHATENAYVKKKTVLDTRFCGYLADKVQLIFTCRARSRAYLSAKPTLRSNVLTVNDNGIMQIM